MSIARRFAVTGWVRNEPDGTVRLVAEATPAELDRFLAAIARAMDRYIRGIDIHEMPATDEFSRFEIRY